MEEEKQVQEEAAVAEETIAEQSILERIMEEGRLAREESQKALAKDLLGEFVSQIMEGTMVVSKDTEAMINARISQIDRLISAQLNEVMHQPEFQKLEASWRGLHFLVHQSETGEKLKIRVMNVSMKDLLKDMEKASEFDQSALFKKVYEEEFGMFGGASYGALIGDYEFSNHPQDLSLLEKISQVAAAAHAPFISAASPKLINLDSFTEIGVPRDMAKIFQSVEYAKWKSFRDSEDSRYVGLALPHILMRLPYGQASVPVESFDFEEAVDGKEHSQYLWGNAAYALGNTLDGGLCQTPLDRGHQGRRGRRACSRSADPHLQDRRRRRGPQVPHRDRHHRPARKGAGRSRLYSPGPLQGYGLCRFFQHPDRQQAQGL